MSDGTKISDTKQCRLCGEDINAVAQKCVNCGGWQTRRRQLISAAGTALPLLIAVLSVLLALLPVLENFILPKKSIISAAFLAEDGNVVTAIGSNSGGRPGAASDAFLAFHDIRGQIWSIHLKIVELGGAASRLIQPGQSIQLQYAPDGNFLPFGKAGASLTEVQHESELIRMFDTTCEFTLLYVNFDASIGRSISSFPCFRMTGLAETEFKKADLASGPTK